MHKKQEESPTEGAVMSVDMLKSCKSEIAKFGFEQKEYTKFLISVKAMRDVDTVMSYSNHEIDQYRAEFVKKHETSIGDTFIFDKCKLKRSAEGGRSSETGYFVPRTFWDSVLKTKSN